jgi:uncharacterized protein YlaI
MALKQSQRTCRYCGVTFFAYSKPSRLRLYCSTYCGGQRSTGTTQSQSHISKRIRIGDQHHHWKGDSATDKSGRTRALRKFSAPDKCGRCLKIGRVDRHHVDGNTLNNEPSNIEFLCRKCHMTVDGRINRMGDVSNGYRMSR